MSKECFEFLNVRRLPAILGLKEAAWLLGMAEEWVSMLAKDGRIPVLGGHAPGCQYFFFSADIMELAADRGWAEKSVAHVRRTFRDKNKAQKEKIAVTEQHAQDSAAN